MALLDHIDWPGPDLTILGRRGRRVLRKGTAGEATIVGIEVERTTSSEGAAEPVYRYALDVRVGTQAVRAGVRQTLSPRGEEAYVGAVVPVKVRGAKVVIDWERHLGTDREVFVTPWRMVDPPAPGVEDRWLRKERARVADARTASLTVLTMAQGQSLIGPLLAVDVQAQLRYSGSGETEQRGLRLQPPVYARHLMRVGATLPAGVDKNGARVTVDWQAAANGEAGFDTAPPPVDATVAPPPAPGVDRFIGALQSFGTQVTGAGDPAHAGDITLEQYAEITGGFVRERVPKKEWDTYAQRFGVPPGRWAQVDAAWRSRTMTDPETGTRYAALYKAACKGRR